MYAAALASDPVRDREVEKAIYLSLPRLCCPLPPSAGGVLDLAFWAPCWKGSSADYDPYGPAPLQRSLSRAGVSKIGKELLKGGSRIGFGPKDRLLPRLLIAK